MTTPNSRLLVCITALFAVTSSAQARMVVDLNRNPGRAPGSQPNSFFSTPSVTYFAAATLATGSELWGLDNQGQARLLLDIYAGAASASPTGTVVFAGGLILSAFDVSTGREPWRVDANGFGRALDVRMGNGGSDPMDFTVTPSMVFFTADDGAHGRELWVTDGTSSGTRLVLDIALGADASTPKHLTRFGNQVVFRARTAAHGAELWISDGTASGTRMLLDVHPGPADGMVDAKPAIGRTGVIFTADDGTHGREPWISDGTSAGTALLRDCNPGSNPSNASQLTTMTDGRVMFGAFATLHGGEPWITDGSTAGTQMILDLLPGIDGSTARDFCATSDGRCFFYAVAPGAGLELHITDGSASGTQTIDFTPGPASTWLASLMASGTRAYFVESGTRSLGASDGTVAGSARLTPTGTAVTNLAVAPLAGGGVIFAALSPASGDEPWVSDGTVAGTRLVVDINQFATTEGSGATVLGEIGGRVLFQATDGTQLGLWASVGSAAGTAYLGAYDRRYHPNDEVAALRDSLLLFGNNMVVRTDGTAQGTSLITHRSLPMILGHSGFLVSVRADDRVLFAAQDPPNPWATLWHTDGTTAGTQQLSSVMNPHDFVNAGDLTFFVSDEANLNSSLWRTDGSAAGTRAVHHFGRLTLSPDLLGAVGGRVLFAAYDQGNLALWSSDGTSAGTRVIAPVAPLNFAYSSAAAVTVGNRMVIATLDGVVASDGTPAGTTRLVTLPNRVVPQTQIARIGDRALVLLTHIGTTAMYVTDGTVAGTQYVTYPLPASVPSLFVPLNATSVAWAIDNGPGQHTLVVSDGTAAGTRRLGDVPGIRPASSFVGRIVDGEIYFAIYDVIHGSELWGMTVGATAEPEGRGCSGDIFELQATAPLLGRDWTCRALTTLPFAVLLLGRPAWPPQPLSWPTCVAYVDLNQTLALPLAAPSQSLTMRLPPSLALAGLRLAAQVVAVPSTPFGVALSNGLRVTVR